MCDSVLSLNDGFCPSWDLVESDLQVNAVRFKISVKLLSRDQSLDRMSECQLTLRIR